MLKTIKDMLGQKQALMEAADLLLEGTIPGQLDDSIFLKEDGEEDTAGMVEPVEESDDDDDTITPETPVEPSSGADVGDVMDEPMDEPDEEEPAEPGPIEDEPMPLPGDDLPEPVGKQTEEPINDNNDILSVEVDLGSNTMKDVLPVPPGGAIDSIGGDSMEHRVDSGFGGEPATPPIENDLLDAPMDDEPPVDPDPDPSAGEPVEEDGGTEPPSADAGGEGDEGLGESVTSKINQFAESQKATFNVFDQIFSEAITIGDAPQQNNNGGGGAEPDANGDVPPAEFDVNAPMDDGAGGGGDAAPDTGGDNTVTAAVKDKVEEMSSESDVDGSADVGGGKADLMKKLGSITKSLEDAKQAVMNALQ